MVIGDSYVCNQLYFIPLTDLQPDPNQPRKYLDPAALDELTASVVEHGVLEPIIFRTDNGLCYVVAGERRCDAARRAGLNKIPAIFIDSRNYEEISLVENMLRADLTPVEEAEALDRLRTARNYQQEDLARVIGKSRVTVTESLSLNKLPPVIKNECRKDPSVPKRILVDIARKKSEQSMIKAFNAYKASLNPKKKNKMTRTTRAEAFVNASYVLEDRIADLDMETMTEKEKDNILTSAESLRDALGTLIACWSSTLPEEEATA
jgi:ParB family transcriptional regulator, chromosome partitioning protein